MSSTSVKMPPVDRVPSGATRKLFWKEMRQNLPVLVIFLGLFSVVVAFFHQSPDLRESDGTLWARIGWCILCFLSLTLGVFLFAPEKESGTVDFLKQLPVSSWFIVRHKILVGFAILAIFVFLATLFHFYDFYFASSPSQQKFAYFSKLKLSVPEICLIGIGFPIECFLCGVLCSLFISRAIFAAVSAFAMTGAIVVFSIQFASANDGFYSIGSEVQMQFTLTIVVINALAMSVIGFFIYSIGTEWVGNAPQNQQTSYPREAFAASSLSKPTAAQPRTGVSQGRIFQSLIWQTWRQIRIPFLVLAAILFTVCAAVIVNFGFINQVSHSGQGTLWTGAIWMALVSFACGQLAFLNDNTKNNFRFFQQHGGQARIVWLARLLPAAMLTSLSILTICFLVSGIDRVNPRTPLLAGSVLLILSAFALGQFNSMMFKSYVFAVATTLFLLAALSMWANYIYSLNENLWIFFLPIPLVMLTVTWWWAPRWIAGGNEKATRLLVDSAIPLTLLVLFVALATYRYNQIPNPNFSFTSLTAQYDSLNELEIDSTDNLNLQKAKCILQATETIDLTPDTLDEFLNVNQYPAELLQEADTIDAILPILDPASPKARETQIAKIRRLISAEAKGAQAKGDLDEALNHWLRLERFENQYVTGAPLPDNAIVNLIQWSEHPDQSSERIGKAIDAIKMTEEKWNRRHSAALYESKVEFENWFEDFKNGKQHNNPNLLVNRSYSFSAWELERNRRVIQKRLSQRSKSNMRAAMNEQLAVSIQAGSSSPVYRMRDNPFFDYQESNVERTQADAQTIQQRRYAKIRMALAAWCCDKQGYPKKLKELTPDYLDRLPRDCTGSGKFYYAPNGLKQNVSWSSRVSRIVNSQMQQFDKQLFDKQQFDYEFLFGGAGPGIDLGNSPQALENDEAELSQTAQQPSSTGETSNEKIVVPFIDPIQTISANTPFLLPWSISDQIDSRFRFESNAGEFILESEGDPNAGKTFVDLSDPMHFWNQTDFHFEFELKKDSD